MKLRGCERRDEVQGVLLRGQWPAGCDAELREHVAACRECSVRVLVGGEILAAKTESLAHARPEPAELVWWRARLRKRQQAMETVTRPVRGVQIFTAALVLCAAVWVMGQGIGWKDWLKQMVAAASGAGLMPLALVAAAVVLLAGVVVYLTMERE